MLVEPFLTLRQLAFQFCDLGGFVDLLALERLQQVVHVLPHLVFDLVPFKLGDLHGLLAGRFIRRFVSHIKYIGVAD